MKTTGRVNGIISNIVIVKADGPVGQNEICHVYCGDTKMMAEVIKVVGDNAYVQVFDSTRGLKIGEKVEFEGHMLEATLAPGLLSRNYDGLQNDLEKMDGLFIARGSITDPIDFEKKWEFKPLAKPGDKVSAASWLGQVKEEWVEHKIMVPFTMEGTYTVKSVARRRVQGYGHDRRHHRCRRSGSRYYDGSAVAREAGRALLPGEATPLARHGDGRAGHRHFQPAGRGRYGLHPRTFRCG